MGGRGSGGKNRKPAAIKKAEGNRGKRANKKAAQTSLPGEPPMPGFLTSPRMRAVWKMMVPMLKEKGVLTKDCGIALGSLCSSFVHFSVADADVSHREHQIRTKQNEREHLEDKIDFLSKQLGAAVRRRSDLLRHLRAAYQSFGLDPASSGGISLSDPKTPGEMKNRFEQILTARSDQDEVVN